MWIEVQRWSQGRVSGLLANDPQDRPDLKAGQSVGIAEADVYDCMLMKPDGTYEGNLTAEVLEKQ